MKRASGAVLLILGAGIAALGAGAIVERGMDGPFIFGIGAMLLMSGWLLRKG